MSSKPEDTLHSEKDVKQIIICGACRFECENVKVMQGHMIAEHTSNEVDEILLKHGAEPGEFTHSLKQALTQYISTLVEGMLPEKKPDLRGIKYGEYRGYNQAIAEMRQKLNEWKNSVK